MSEKHPITVPTLEEISKERKRIKLSEHYRKAMRGTISVLVVVAAVSVLIATLLLPILQISGDSMSPTFNDKEIVVMWKSDNLKRGDVIGFYYQGKVLLKRIIAEPGDTVVIDDDGNVYVNKELLKEEYVAEKSLGNCDIEFPYTVPEQSYFVMGDKRSNSVDSRSSAIGSVPKDQIIGRVFLRVWQLNKIKFF